MTNRSGRHVTAPQITLYKPSMPGFARHRKPPVWHVHNLIAYALNQAGERMMRDRG